MWCCDWFGSSSPHRLSKSKPTSPFASLRLILTADSTASSWTSTSARLVCPRESKAPALINDSTVRLFAAWIGTLPRKSWNDSKRPLPSRASLTPSTTFAPTLRTAPMPKRMSSPTAAKYRFDSLTSGGSTLMPMRRHSLR